VGDKSWEIQTKKLVKAEKIQNKSLDGFPVNEKFS
jgi:hypothetical protein